MIHQSLCLDVRWYDPAPCSNNTDNTEFLGILLRTFFPPSPMSHIGLGIKWTWVDARSLANSNYVAPKLSVSRRRWVGSAMYSVQCAVLLMAVVKASLAAATLQDRAVSVVYRRVARPFTSHSAETSVVIRSTDRVTRTHVVRLTTQYIEANRPHDRLSGLQCCHLSLVLLWPRPPQDGALWNDDRCLSVCPSVCRIPRPNSRTKGLGSPKLAWSKPITRVIREIKGRKVKDQGHQAE